MKTITKYIIAILALLVVITLSAPCFLVFSEGAEGEPTIWNAVGLIYCILFGRCIGKLLKRLDNDLS